MMYRAAFVSALLLTLFAEPVFAEPTLELRVSGPKEIFPGDPVSTTIDAHGQVTLGPELTELGSTGESSIVSMLPVKGAVYVGTAGGALYRVEARARTAKKLTSHKKVIFSALAERNGRLYAATSPDGKIFTVDRKGKRTAYANPGAKYVWSMLPSDSGLIAATGEPGRVISVGAKGTTSVLFDPEETHVRVLLRHPKRGVIAGSGQKGIVYQLGEKKGSAYALYDSDHDEVTALAVDPKSGDLFCAFVSESKKGKFIPGKSIGAVAKDAKDSGSPIKSSEVVRISMDGRVDVLWSSHREGALGLAFAPDEKRLFIATGTGVKERGRIYAIDTLDRDRIMLIARVEPPLATAIARVGKAMIVGTGPSGRVIRLGPSARKTGVYLSLEQPLHGTAQIGRVWYDADAPKGSKVSVFLRSGNTEEHGPTWSEWSAAVTDPSGGEIKVPKAHFAQFKVELTAAPNGRSPTIKSLHASVVRMNVAPSVDEVFVLRPGVYMRAMPKEEDKEKSLTLNKSSIDRLRSYSAPDKDTRVRQGIMPGWMTTSWTAHDRNGDELLYRVELRRLDGAPKDNPWQRLADDSEHIFHSFDSRAFPDGRYQVRVTATDRPSNPPAHALTDGNQSEPFTIDNQPPEITDISAQSPKRGVLVVRAKAKDAASILGFAELSVNGGPWLMFPARDGLTDAREENFEVTMRAKDEPGALKIDKGRHSVAVRVQDEIGNEATRSTFVNAR